MTKQDLLLQAEELRSRLEVAEETLRAIRSGEVDALVVYAPEGESVYTLKSAEQPYRIMVETMNEGALTLSGDGTVLYCNARFAELVKTPLQQMMGSSLRHLVAPSDQRKFDALVQMPDGKDEITLTASDGTSTPTQFSTRSLHTDGRPAICVVVTDLTDRVMATRSLQASEARFRALAETTSAAIFITEGLRILYANDAAQGLTGYSCDELLDMELWQFTHPAYQEILKRHGLIRSYAPNIPNRFELRILTQAGEERWWDVTTGEIEYEGRPAFIVTAFDITERDRAEKALQKAKEELEVRVAQRTADLREANTALSAANEQLQAQAEELQAASEELTTQNEELRAAQTALDAERRCYQELFDFAPGGYLVTDPQGTIREANRAAAEMLGAQTSKLVGKSLTIFVDERERQALYAQLEQLQQGQEIHQWEMRLQPRGHEPFPALVDATPTRDAQGQIGGFRWLLRDITERKRAEEEIARLAKFPSENPNPILRLSQAGIVLYANEASVPLLQEWGCVVGGYAPESWRHLITEAFTNGLSRTVDVECQERVYSFVVVPIREVGYVNLYGTDITERKRAEEALLRLNRTLRAHSHSDQAMMRAATEAEYMQQVCNIIVQDCGHAMVWIGFAEEDEARSVRPVAYASFEEGYLETLHITWADTERGRGPTGTAIRTGKPSFCRNMLTDPDFAPWRAEALKRGYAASLVLPLLDQGRAFGALTIYFREPDPFTEDEINLLSGLADDLTYGIKTLRLRAAHALSEAALRQSEERYRSLFEGMTEGFALHEIICDEQGQPCDYRFLEINPSFERLTGLRREDVVGKNHNEVLPNDNPLWVEMYGQVALTGQPVHFENYSPVLKRHYEAFSYCPAPRQFAMVFMDITGRKRLEEEREQLLEQAAALAARDEAILNNMAEGMAITDRHGNVIMENPAALTQHGYHSVQEIQIHLDRFGPLFETTYPDGRPMPLDEWSVSRALRGETFQNMETVVHRVDQGWTKTISYGGAPVRDKDGNVALAVVTSRDITAQKEAEAEREQLLAQIQRHANEMDAFVAAMTDAMIVYDGQHSRLLRLNRAAEAMYGPNATGLDHQTLGRRLNLRYPDGRPVAFDDMPLARALHGEQVANAPYLANDWQGHEIIVLASVSPLAANGSIYGAVGVWHDITEHERLASEVQRRAAELDATITAIADGVMLFDPEAHVQRMNPAASKILGNMEDGQAMPPAERLARLRVETADGARLTRGNYVPVLQALRGETVQGLLLSLQIPGENKKWLSTSAAPVRAADGRMLGAVVSFNDITELRQTQQRLQDSNERLQSQTEELQTLTEELGKARDELELRVQERTAELAQANVE